MKLENEKKNTCAMTPATHLPDNSSLAICRMEKSERLFRHLMPNCDQGMACAKKTPKKPQPPCWAK